MSQQSSGKLKRGLNFFSSFIFVVGGTVGSGIFLVASDVSQAVQNPALALSTWIVAGSISLLGALCFSELGAMFPNAGGPYLYYKEALHPLVGFLYGWTQILVVQPGAIAGISVSFAIFASKLIPVSAITIKIVATALILAFTLLNTFGVEKASKFLNVVTPLKIVAIVGFAILSLVAPTTRPVELHATFSDINLSAYGVALIAAFWAFEGWGYLSFIAGEVENPKKTLPLAFASGLTVITLLYLFSSLAYFRVLSSQEIANSTFVAADAAMILAGPIGVTVMTLMVMLSAVGCINGVILSGARVVFAMAKNGNFPKIFGTLNPKTNTPNAALIFQLCWSLLLVWSGSYSQIVAYVIFAAYIFYGLSSVAVMNLRRKRPSLTRPYRVPLYPYLPIGYGCITLAFTLNAVTQRPFESLAGLCLILLGIPSFYYFENKHRTRK